MMEQSQLRRHILRNTLLWLAVLAGFVLTSFVLNLFGNSRLTVDGAFPLVVLGLPALSLFAPPRLFQNFKQWQDLLLYFGVACIYYLPAFLLRLFKPSLLEMSLSQGGWFIFFGLLFYVYLAMIAVLTLSHLWLTRRQAG